LPSIAAVYVTPGTLFLGRPFGALVSGGTFITRGDAPYGHLSWAALGRALALKTKDRRDSWYQRVANFPAATILVSAHCKAEKPG